MDIKIYSGSLGRTNAKRYIEKITATTGHADAPNVDLFLRPDGAYEIDPNDVKKMLHESEKQDKITTTETQTQIEGQTMQHQKHQNHTEHHEHNVAAEAPAVINAPVTLTKLQKAEARVVKAQEALAKAQEEAGKTEGKSEAEVQGLQAAVRLAEAKLGKANSDVTAAKADEEAKAIKDEVDAAIKARKDEDRKKRQADEEAARIKREADRRERAEKDAQADAEYAAKREDRIKNLQDSIAAAQAELQELLNGGARMQNGIREPSSGTLTGNVWALIRENSADDLSAMLTVGKLIELAKVDERTRAGTEGMLRTQYYGFRKFHGITGR